MIWPRRKRKISPERLEIAETMRAAGKTYKQIAEALKISEVGAYWIINPERKHHPLTRRSNR